MAEEFDSKSDAKAPDDRYRRWMDEIALAQKEEKPWIERAGKVIDRYRDEKRTGGRKFNILWANVETLKPTVYSHTPKPVVRRRYLDADPIGREAADVLQRALTAAIDEYDFDGAIENVRDDLLLAGRGVARVEYEPVIGRRPAKEGETPDGEDDDGAYIEAIERQYVKCCYVYWRDFIVSPARTWKDVRWLGFRHLMTAEDLKREFPGKHVERTVDATPNTDRQKRSDDPPDMFKRAEVWEIWDKDSRKRLFVSDGAKEILREEEDPLKLEGFFPVPEPVYAVRTSDNLVPIPEYTMYQDQAQEIDQVTVRIDKLVSALKVRGFYPAAVKEMADLLGHGDDAKLWPVADWEGLMQQGGGSFDKLIAILPIETIANVLAGLAAHREQLKQEIYELTGISDIVRGSSKEQETATAQRIKGNYAQVRMTPRSRPMQKFIRDLLRLKAEIMAEHYTPETLARMVGKPIRPEVMMLLKNDKLRDFRIDVETDSTVAPDEEAEKQAVNELLTSVTGFLDASLKIGAAEPLMVPMLLEMLKMAVRRYRAGQELEDVIDQTSQAVVQKIQNPPPPPPDPNIIKAEADVKVKQAELQMKGQAQQAEMGMKREEHAMNMQARTAEIAMEQDAKRMELAIDMEGKQLQAQVDREVAGQQMAQSQAEHEMSMEHQAQAGALKLEQQKAAAKAKPAQPR